MALTDIQCRTTKPEEKPKKLADEKGLYLLVKLAGKYWRWDYRFAGRRQTMALGVYPEVDLKTARKRRDAGRLELSEGRNPMVSRTTAKRAAANEHANTFEGAARAWLDFQAKKWAPRTRAKNLKHFTADVFPFIGRRPTAQILPEEIKKVLDRIEGRDAAYTAGRIKEMCSQVFRHAIAVGVAKRNPAAEMMNTLVVPATKHRPALTNPLEFGMFLRDLRAYRAADQITLLATWFALLTFVRSSELRFAKWSEIDIEGREWRIPALRMKMNKGSNQQHIVPLSPQAIEVLRQLRPLSGQFPNMFPNTYGPDGFMSENTIGRMLIRMGYQGRQTLHGFRASARSILSERGWSFAALERQLDHAEHSKVVAAYARAEHLNERRKLMDDWGSLVQQLESAKGT